MNIEGFRSKLEMYKTIYDGTSDMQIPSSIAQVFEELIEDLDSAVARLLDDVTGMGVDAAARLLDVQRDDKV